MRPALSTSPSSPTAGAAAEEVEAPAEFDLDAEAPLELDLDARVGPDAEPEDGSRERRLLCAPTSREKSEITVAAPSGFSGFHIRKRKRKCYYPSDKYLHEN